MLTVCGVIRRISEADEFSSDPRRMFVTVLISKPS